MAEYIKREYAIKTHCNLCRETWVCDGNEACCYEVKAFKRIPAADVVEVRHGHWIDTGSGQECSLCREIQYGYDSGRRYCQNCGAVMDESEGEE